MSIYIYLYLSSKFLRTLRVERGKAHGRRPSEAGLTSYIRSLSIYIHDYPSIYIIRLYLSSKFLRTLRVERRQAHGRRAHGLT